MFWGSYIVADLDPFDVLTSYSVDRLKMEFEKFSPIVHGLGLAEQWKATKLFGITAPSPTPRPAYIGVSLYIPQNTGIGYCEFLNGGLPDYRSPTYKKHPELLSRMDPEIRKTMRWVETQAAIVRVVYEASKTAIEIPTRLTIDNFGYPRTFERAYSDRLAYALGFEASIKEQSYTLYEKYFHAIKEPSLETLMQIAPSVQDPHAFSIYLNMQSFIYNMVSWQEVKRQRHPLLTADLVNVDVKSAFVQEYLLRAAELRSRSLIQDGQEVLQLLLIWLARQREHKILSTGAGIDWGVDSRVRATGDFTK